MGFSGAIPAPFCGTCHQVQFSWFRIARNRAQGVLPVNGEEDSYQASTSVSCPTVDSVQLCRAIGIETHFYEDPGRRGVRE